MSRVVTPLNRFCLLLCCLMSFAPIALCAAPCSSQATARDSSSSLLDRGEYAALDARLSEAQSSYRAGSINDIQLQASFVLCSTDARLRAKYDAWVAAMPRSYVARLARANYLRFAGWNARGEDAAKDTSEDQFAAMEAFNAQARRDYEVSLQLEPKPILSYSGLVDLTRHDNSSGKKLLEDALKIDPKAFVVRRVYMSTLQTRWGGSVQQMEQFALESKPHITASQSHVLDAMVIQDRAWHIEQQGDELAAAHLFQSALERVDDPSQANSSWYGELAFEAGWAYQQASDLATAMVWFRQALASDPQNVHAMSNLAWSLQQTGHAVEAASYYLKGASLGDSFAEDRYGRCLWSGSGVAKDQAAAVSYFKRAADSGSEEGGQDLYWAYNQLHQPLPEPPKDEGPKDD